MKKQIKIIRIIGRNCYKKDLGHTHNLEELQISILFGLSLQIVAIKNPPPNLLRNPMLAIKIIGRILNSQLREKISTENFKRFGKNTIKIEEMIWWMSSMLKITTLIWIKISQDIRKDSEQANQPTKWLRVELLDSLSVSKEPQPRMSLSLIMKAKNQMNRTRIKSLA